MVEIRKSLQGLHQPQAYPEKIVSERLPLDRNESPLLPSAFVQEAIIQELSQLSRYPENSAFALRQALGGNWQLAPDHFLIGNGSFEILSLLAQVFLDTTSQVIVPQGTFIWHKKFSHFSGAKVETVPLDPQYQVSLAAIQAAIIPETKMIWLTDPFNPTGTKLNPDQLHQFCREVPSSVVIVIDEAYMEFSDGDTLENSRKLVESFDNVILLRTFSKFYRLASVRIGYAVAQPALIQMILPYRIPPNHNRLGVAAAVASLADNKSQQETLHFMKKEKSHLTQALTELGFKVIPSHANFLFVSLENHPNAMINKLAEQVIFKPGKYFGYPSHFRLTIGTTDQNRQVIEMLKQLIN
ncbi:pyridoxal phosphate-dependent aminotransferase [Trichococcus alkaliphilus]|uniref:pyridoxal phosphate-dependent aminotransferase n=1 Tax=Trichococcus alkaliphilus TaxID=2052943 RepID=UPI001374C050|nr:histidinol-phosphate transaminase [Trichococcus alkaliphilus]